MKRKFEDDLPDRKTGKSRMQASAREPKQQSLQLINSYSDLKKVKLSIPTLLQHPRIHQLNLMSENYRLHGKKLIPYTDAQGVTFPLDSWMEIVPAVNRFMKTCVEGKMIKTYYSDDTHRPARPPSGLHVFAVPRDITQGLIVDAMRDLDKIYWSNKYRQDKRIHIQKHTASPACNLLFYAGCSANQPKISEIFQILFAEAPALARYALMYLSVIRDILRLDSDKMDLVNMTLVHYDPLGGINPHVDTVFLFNGTLGPIFTVAMGPNEKMLDILPVLLPDSYSPIRVFTNPNEILLLDGESRALYAHGKPLNYPYEQYTLVFKCPEFQTKTHTTLFEYDGKTLEVPYHYVNSSESLGEVRC